MRKLLSSSVAALLVTGLAVAPLATSFTMLSADAAFAKSDKAKDKGKKDKKKPKKKNNDKKAKKGGKPEKAGAAKAANAKPVKVKKTVGDTGLHPSELGNMNGALNANINAVLAHIRNGNTNGPVGTVARLAVANAAADAATELLASSSASEYAQLQEALAGSEYATVEDYLAAKANGGDGFVTDEAIEAALSGLGAHELDAAVDANEQYETAADYYLAKAEAEAGVGDGTFVIDDAIEAASADLGVYDPETAAALADAEAAIMEQDDAESAALALWNKNPDADPEVITEEEQVLLDALNARLVGFEDDIATAIDASETHGAGDADDDDDDLVQDDCDEGDLDCEIPSDEEIVLIIE